MTDHPIHQLRARSPGLFVSPDFWRSRWKDVVAQSSTRKERIGRSAGGREIPAFCFGDSEPVSPTATISSATASDNPAAFYDPSRRRKPSLAILGSIHGGETEGIALCLNLIQLLETGHDWCGDSHPGLVQKLRQVRLCIVPCLNPDGREAAGIHHLNGAELDDLYLVQQGLLADGTPFQGRKVKEIQPIPKGMMQFLGGYYNAEGVNLQHDDFLGPRIAPENEAVRTLFRREIPDAFLTLHAHGTLPALLVPDAYVSPGVQRKQIEMAGFIMGCFQNRGIAFLPPDRIVAPPWSFYFQTWLHHMTGATPLLFEFSHGLKIQPCSLGDVLTCGYALIEGWLDYCRTCGPRALDHALFGKVTPA